MSFTLSTLVAVLGLSGQVLAHMEITSPVPYGKSTLNNSPLAADGSDFPCKQRTGVYDAEGASNTMPIGSTQTLAFIGTAVHGGGSCQISVTYDENPTASSTWKVIHSIEGGCPARNQVGNLPGDSASLPAPDTYTYSIPSSLPTGTATLAWTWHNKIGNREMYMNCAPITITGSSSSKRDEDEFESRNATQLMVRDTSAYDALPDMFVANIGNGCATLDSQDVAYPNPGDSLEQLGLSTLKPVAPSGTGCAKAVAQASGGASSASAVVSSAPTSAAVASSATAEASAPPGGVFVTTAVASAAPTSAQQPVASDTPATSAAAAASPVASSSSGTSSGTSMSSGSLLTGACTDEGAWNCISGGTSFQRCASGSWSVAMPVAAGTTCTANGIMRVRSFRA